MKKILYISLTIVCWLIVSPIHSQQVKTLYTGNLHDTGSLTALLQLDSDETNLLNNFQTEMELFVRQLERKRSRYKVESDFLRFVFFQVHKKFLKRYRQPSTMRDLFNKHEYDCVSGTALYALIFERLGLNYKVIETTYHIYLTLETENGPVLIESTSPLGGFMSDPTLIEQSITRYTSPDNTGNWSKKDYYKLDESINNEISLKQLVGLQYHNLAVESYNQKELHMALILQEKALLHYPSARHKEMMAVMISTLAGDNNFDPLAKHYFLSTYDYLRQSYITANRNR